MKNMMIILIAILFLVFIFKNYYNIVSILNSHFGTNLSTKESDNKNKSLKNLISKLYDNLIETFYNNSPFKKYVVPSSVKSIDVSELTKEKFISLTNNFREPLVVKGFLKNSKAVKEWDLDFFADKYGDTKLPVILNADIKDHKTYINNNASEKYEYVTLKEFVASIKDGKKMYINNISRIFGYHPELLDYLELENIEKYTGENIKNEIHITNLFFGGNGTGTSLHCSITGNFFYNIKGQKLWYLIKPQYTKYLRPILSRTGLFAVSRLDICNAKVGDYVLNIPRYEVLLEEGDMLLNPSFYWHAVTNKSEFTLACANRFTKFGAALKNNPLYSLIFFSHPFANYNDFGKATTRKEANIEFDKALLADILKNKEQIK